MKHHRAIAAVLTIGLASALSLAAVAAPASAEEPVEEQRLVLTPADYIARAGQVVQYEVTFVDEFGEPADPQPDLEYTLSTDLAGDVIDGDTVSGTRSGPRTVFVRSGQYYGMTELTIIGDPVELSIVPSALKVEKGGTLLFDITGVDEWGTVFGAGDDAVLTSSVSTDIIEPGGIVTFPTASPHTITARVGDVTASVTIEVVDTAAAAPAAPAAPTPGAPKLAETGVEVNAATLVAGAFLLLGSLVMGRRRAAR